MQHDILMCDLASRLNVRSRCMQIYYSSHPFAANGMIAVDIRILARSEEQVYHGGRTNVIIVNLSLLVFY